MAFSRDSLLSGEGVGTRVRFKTDEFLGVDDLEFLLPGEATAVAKMLNAAQVVGGPLSVFPVDGGRVTDRHEGGTALFHVQIKENDVIAKAPADCRREGPTELGAPRQRAVVQLRPRGVRSWKLVHGCSSARLGSGTVWTHLLS